MNLWILSILVLITASDNLKLGFPSEGLDNLVDLCDYTIGNSMVNNNTRLTKKRYDEEKRYGANGTGKDRLKVCYQNRGNKLHTFDMIDDIETMLNNVRPHVLIMSENRLDQLTKDRLENQHNFVTEELGPGERIWAAIRSKVPYKRRKEFEIKGICAIWLEFGTGTQKYLICGAYREFRLVGKKNSRTGAEQLVRWKKFMEMVSHVIHTTGLEVHLLGDLNLDTKRWPQLGSKCKNWPHVPLVNELYSSLINGAGMILSEGNGDTWVNPDGTRSSCLDIHLCNNPKKVKSVTTTNEFTKDHQTLVLTRREEKVE